MKLPNISEREVTPLSVSAGEAKIDHGGRRATAVAKTDCTIIPASEKHFLFMVEETPFFALTVMRTMTARLRRLDMLSEYRD